MSSPRQVWSKQNAEWYVTNYGDHISNALTIQHAHLQENDILLDIGCGSGTACRQAAKLITNGTIIGVDPTPSMIRYAKDLTNDAVIQFMAGSAENIPLDDHSVTVCTAINSLHHWHNYQKGFQEIKRVLTPTGCLIISDEIVIDDSCGHGAGPLSKPDKVINELRIAGFNNMKLELIEKDGEGIYLFLAKNTKNIFLRPF